MPWPWREGIRTAGGDVVRLPADWNDGGSHRFRHALRLYSVDYMEVNYTTVALIVTNSGTGKRGARRTSKPFCPRRTRRGAENFKIFLSAEGAEGRREIQNPFCPRRTRRGGGKFKTLFVRGGRGGAAGNSKPFLSAEGAEGRGELQNLFVRGGRGGTRRTNGSF